MGKLALRNRHINNVFLLFPELRVTLDFFFLPLFQRIVVPPGLLYWFSEYT